MLFRSPKGFLNGILMLLIFDANYIFVVKEVSKRCHEMTLPCNSYSMGL